MKYLSLLVSTLLFSLVASAALPPIIVPSALCVGASTTLTNATSGGTWSSSDVAVVTIGASSGIASGVSVGTATITYTDGVDFAYASVSVNAAPTSVSGPTTICNGSTVALTAAPGGGVWSSANSSVAAVGSTSGIATGLAMGTTTITYTLPSSCYAVVPVTVSPTPSVFGSSAVCIGTPATYISTVTGGTWSVSPSSIATVTSGGIVSGVSPGLATVSYTSASGCIGSLVVTVNPGVLPITGTPATCLGLTTLLSSATPGGTWVSAVPSVGTVSSSTGAVTGISLGTTTISYVVATGCASSVLVTVNSTAGAISGTATLCAGSTTALSAATGPGGVWSSSASSVATVGTAGVVYGTGIGTATISYTTSACGSTSRVVTVNSSCSGTPVAGAITASAPIVCSGTPVILNLPTYTSACGHIRQWQYSPDGFTWTDLPGANTVPYTYNPTVPYYYRCRLTCASTGLSAYSGPVFVGINFQVGTHYVIDTPSALCLPTDFYVSACGVSSTFSIITAFGDGTSDTTVLSTATLSDAHVFHTYALPGVYTVRHILLNAGTPVDTIAFTYNYNFCRTLPFRFYVDANGNCAFDAGEIYNFHPVTVQIDSNGVAVDTMVVTSGLSYKALGAPGTIYAFRPLAVAGGFMVACASGVLYDTITSYTNTYVTKYFGVSCSPSPSFDLRVAATAGTGRHSQRFNIVVSNDNCSPVAPVLTLTFSPKYGYYAGVGISSPAPTSVVGNTITWNLSTLDAFSTRNVSVWLERPASIGPWLTPGDTVNSRISVAPFAGDADTTNNTITRLDTVKASFDPNDLTVAPDGYILPCGWLEYRVRFENTGNDTAHNIYVVDTLPAEVDPASLEAIAASHAMNISVINDGVYNIAKFDFPEIKLLDTSYHMLCNGMFTFRVKTYSTLPDGIAIMNRVGIYFDDNEVVMTNEVHNTTGIPPIEGPGHICLGYPDTLFNSMPGGTWASSTPATGTISTLGIVTGIVAGTTAISYTASNGCATRTATREVTVSPISVPSVDLITVDDTVCSGSPVIFNAVPVNGGLTPAYSWKINGTIVSAGSAYSYLPLDGDHVLVTMTSSEACTLPPVVVDSVVMTVFATGTPIASVAISPGDTSCAGSPVTFTTTPVMGGSTPGYLWFVNGTLVGSGASYVYTPVNGDAIFCRMGSNYMCRLADTVNSVIINQTVDPLYIPVISLSASPGLVANAGDPVTFTASVINAGPAPVYQWFVNTTLVSGAVGPTFTSTTLADYDSVSCRVTGSGVCNISSFNSVFVTILPAGVTNVIGDASVRLFPNPNNGGFRVKAVTDVSAGSNVVLSITNVLGQLVYSKEALVTRGSIDETIQLPPTLANGVYMLVLRTGTDSKMFRFVVDR